jgi:hypothetical protein
MRYILILFCFILFTFTPLECPVFQYRDDTNIKIPIFHTWYKIPFKILMGFTVAHADIYKYIDKNGVICYTDTPFGKNAKRVIKDNTNPTSTQQSAKIGPKNTAGYHQIVHEKAKEYNIDPSLVKAVIKTESNWNYMAVSRKGAMGLMQLMPSTANDMNVHNPFNPEENIEGGVKYLKYLLERFNGDLTLALAAYNAGPKTVEKFGLVPPITETRQYVSKVLSLYNGKMTYPLTEDEPKEKKPDPIYKIILEDGTVLFTNSTFLSKNPVRF